VRAFFGWIAIAAKGLIGTWAWHHHLNGFIRFGKFQSTPLLFAFPSLVLLSLEIWWNRLSDNPINSSVFYISWLHCCDFCIVATSAEDIDRIGNSFLETWHLRRSDDVFVNLLISRCFFFSARYADHGAIWNAFAFRRNIKRFAILIERKRPVNIISIINLFSFD